MIPFDCLYKNESNGKYSNINESKLPVNSSSKDTLRWYYSVFCEEITQVTRIQIIKDVGFPLKTD